MFFCSPPFNSFSFGYYSSRQRFHKCQWSFAPLKKNYIVFYILWVAEFFLNQFSLWWVLAKRSYNVIYHPLQFSHFKKKVKISKFRRKKIKRSYLEKTLPIKAQNLDKNLRRWFKVKFWNQKRLVLKGDLVTADKNTKDPSKLEKKRRVKQIL